MTLLAKNAVALLALVFSATVVQTQSSTATVEGGSVTRVHPSKPCDCWLLVLEFRALLHRLPVSLSLTGRFLKARQN